MSIIIYIIILSYSFILAVMERSVVLICQRPVVTLSCCGWFDKLVLRAWCYAWEMGERELAATRQLSSWTVPCPKFGIGTLLPYHM